MDTLPSANELATLQLGASIRRLRQIAGLKGKELGRLVHMSQSKISKIETGSTAPSVSDLRSILDALDVPADLKSEVLSQFDMIALPEGDYQKIYSLGVAWKQREIQDYERRAKLIRGFEIAIIPGLLQTRDYARSVISEIQELSGRQIDEAVEARSERQELLWDSSRIFEFVVLEAALWSFPQGFTAQLAQLDRISSLANRPNIKVGIVRTRSKLPSVLNSFTIFDDVYVSSETIASEVVSLAPSSIREYSQAFAELTSVADFDAQSLLGRIAEEMERSSTV